MKKHKFKIIYLVIFFISFGALALPEFDVKVGEETLTYPGIGFSRIGIGEDFGSFTKGKDIYPSTEFRAEVTYSVNNISEEQKDSTLEELRDIVRERADYAGLFDISISTIEIESKDYISIEVPNNYENPRDYASWLVSQGKITFSRSFDGEDVIDLYDYDIEGGVGIRTVLVNDEAIQSLIFSFNEDLAGVISSAAIQRSESDNPILTMNIDDNPQFILQTQRTTDDENYKITDIRAVPFNSYSSTKQTDFLKVVSSYFQEEKPLDDTLTLQTIEIPVTPHYNNEGTTLIAVTFILACLIFAGYVLQQKGIRKAFIATLILSSLLLIVVFELKLVKASLSYGAIYGFIVFLLIGFKYVWDLIQTRDDDLNEILKRYNFVSFTLLISLMAVYKFQLNIDTYEDFIGVLIAGMIAIIISNFLNSKFIKEIEYKYLNKK